MVAAPQDSDAPPLSLARNSEHYVLEGSVRLENGKARLMAKVVRGGSVVWANIYDDDLNVRAILEVQNDIANQVATAIARPYGVIFQADATRVSANAPDDWAAYACTLSYYTYRGSFDPKLAETVRNCLEQAVARFPRLFDRLGHAVADIRRQSALSPQSGSIGAVAPRPRCNRGAPRLGARPGKRTVAASADDGAFLQERYRSSPQGWRTGGRHQSEQFRAARRIRRSSRHVRRMGAGSASSLPRPWTEIPHHRPCWKLRSHSAFTCSTTIKTRRPGSQEPMSG